MLTGLMGATLLSGIAPAYAQAGQAQPRQEGGDRGGRGERMARPEGNVAVSRGNRMIQPRGDDGGQRWQQRGDAGGRGSSGGQGWQQRAADRPAGQMAPPRPDPRWRGDPNLPANRAVEQQVRERREQQQQNWRGDRRDDRPRDDRPRDDRPDVRPERRDDRPNWSNNGREDRRDWRNDGRDNRQDWRNDRRDDDRRDDRRWSDNRGGWSGTSWNNGRRFDDRTRWSSQRRWDSGWRNDRRYDWNSYRNRYGDRYRAGRYYAPRGWDYGYRRFSVGIYLNSLLYSNSYWMDDPYSYRLPPAYGTLRWIRYYDDALLVDIRDGYVVDVINDFFW
ncbi:ATP-dependent RNA helicase [Sphingobium lactosutens]|nr:ATP-dependent RNA helicase [Sphingobium lactosutens]